jgi:TonB-dependent receptor
MKKIFVLLLLALSYGVNAQNILLNGKIFDLDNGTALPGSLVKVSGIQKTITTDVEGRFSILLPEGKSFTLTISSLGYVTKEVSDIKVEKNANVEIGLSRSKANQLKDVVVKSSSRKESAASIFAMQKNSSSISDGISSEIIKKSPDKNIGDVLKRVSGASVQDNKFVVIRGLNERYNTALLNNSILPSTEPDKKAFSFDIIPSSLIDNLLIFKSSTPDLPGDFSGGAIKISTKDYPNEKISELSISSTYNTYTTAKNFYGGFPNEASEMTSFASASRNLPQSYINIGSRLISQTSDVKSSITKSFPNTYGANVLNQAAPSTSVNYLSGNTKTFENGGKLGYIYSITYNNGYKTYDRYRDDYQNYNYILNTSSTNNYEQKNGISALLNLTYSYKKSKYSFKNLFNNDLVRTFSTRQGKNLENAPDYFLLKSQSSEVQQAGLYNSVIEGVHNLNKWVFDWNANFSTTYRYQPDQRILGYRSPNNIDNLYFLSVGNENSPEIRNAGRVFSDLNENIYGANLNFTKNFQINGNSQKIKFGSTVYYRDRTVKVNALGYASKGAFGAVIVESPTTTYNNIFSPENIDKYNLTLADIATNSVGYDANALMNAAYFMYDGKVSEHIKLTTGVRAENYDQTLNTLNQPKTNLNNFDVLPSLLFTYSLNTKSNFRLGASQTVNRPEFRELANYSVYDYDNNVVIRGNPNLKRSTISNFDLRYEFFPNSGEIFSISAFFKQFDNPIEQTNKGNDVFSYNNASSANAYGTEFELRKKLDFINNSFFKKLTFYTNIAFIDGTVQFGSVNVKTPLQGQSPYLINGGLTYSSINDKFSVNLLYNQIGSRLKYRSVTNGGMNIYEKPRDLIDLQISQKIYKDKLELKLTLSDILAQPFVWYYKFDANTSNQNYDANKDRIINSSKYGTNATLSLKWKF